jgi:hypothetical protein
MVTGPFAQDAIFGNTTGLQKADEIGDSGFNLSKVRDQIDPGATSPTLPEKPIYCVYCGTHGKTATGY